MKKTAAVILFAWIPLLLLFQNGLGQQIDPATGGESMSADSANVGFYSLSGPVITETSTGQLSLGFIEFTVPSGFEWDTGGSAPSVTVNLAPGNNGTTQLAIQFDSRTTNKIIFEVTSTSDQAASRPGEATFSGFRVRPTTGILPNDGIITNTGSSAPGGQTSYGDLGMVAGSPAKIRVETAADGSGQVVPEQEITAGNSLTVYSISRDQYDNFLQNIAADGWNLLNGTGGVDNTDLTPAGDSKSATLSSDTTGTGEIQATKSGLTSVTSGTITVQPDDPNSLSINTQPSSTATAGVAFSQQPVVYVLDQFGNRVTTNNSIQITAARKTGTGTLKGTKTITVIQGAATYTNLNHEVANKINIEFSASGFQSVTSTDITVNPASASKLIFSRQPPNGSRDVALDPPPIVQITDQFGNHTTKSSTTVDMTVESGPSGGQISGTTSVTTDSAAAFSDISFNENGSYTIRASDNAAVLTSVVSDTFEIFSPGELAKFSIKNAVTGDDIQDKTAGDSFSIEIKALDGGNNLVTGFSGSVVLTSNGDLTGEPDTTANFTLGLLASHSVQLTSTGNLFIRAQETNGTVVSESNTFNVSPAAADADSSIVTSDKSSITADGSSRAIITVQLKDRFGNNLEAGGDNVTLSTTAGTLSSVTDNGDGTYFATLTSSTDTETAEISGTVNSNAITSGNAFVDFVPGGLDHFAVEADGGGNIGTQTAGQSFLIQVTAQDANNNTAMNFTGTVDITSDKGILSGGGTTASFSSGVLSSHTIAIRESGSATITVTNSDGTQTGTSNSFTVNPGPADVTTTTITSTDRFIQNDGTSSTTITVQAKDQFGNNLTSGGATVELTTSAGTLSSSASGSGTTVTADDNSDGTYTATLTSTTNIETATITGTFNGANIDDDAQVTFTEFNEWTSSGGGGSNPTEWERAGNWTLGVPTSGQAVVIPTNPVNADKFPIVASNPTVAFLDIKDGASVNVDPTFSITITNDVTGAGALIVDGATATVSGDISVANFNAGNSTVTLNGSEEQQIPGLLTTDILNIQNTSQAGITASNYINANTRLTVTDSRLNMQSGSTFEVFNNVTGNGRIDSDDATFRIGGDVTVDTIDVSNSDVTFNGSSGPQTINNITGYRNLTVSNTSGTVTHNGNADISQTLTLNSGASFEVTGDLTTNDLSAAGATLKLQSDFGATGVSAAPDTVAFTGGNPQELIDFDTFNNLTVNKSASAVTSSSDVIVNGTLTLSSGDLVMGSGTNLLAPNRSLTGGQIRFQLELSSRGWYAISSPVASTYADLLDSVVTQGYPGAFYPTGSNPGDTLQPNVLYYDETYAGTDNQRWRALGDASNAIVESRGHFVYVFGDVSGSSLYNQPFPRTLEVGGNEFTGSGSEVDFNVTYTASADTGWNLVGNPYGATIDWDEDGNWTKTNMDNAIYVWDHTANSGNGEYLVWNGITGSLGDGLIAPFQSFWVKANGSSPVLRVSENAKTVGGVFRKSQSRNKTNQKEQEETPVIGFQLSKEDPNLTSELFFTFSENASRKQDSQDAFRLLPFTDTFLEFFSSTEDGDQLVINNLPRRFGKTIDLPIYVGGFEQDRELEGAFTITWPELLEIPPEWTITLEDTETGSVVNLNNTSFYTFDLKPSGSNARSNGNLSESPALRSKSTDRDARFRLHINPGADAGGLPNNVALNQNYPNPFNPTTTIRFGLPVQGDVQIVIYDILGRKIATLANRRFNAGFHTIRWEPDRLASGIYLYRLQTEEKIITKKMTFIK